MAHRVTPYAYRPGRSVLHRLPAGLKLLGLVLLSITGFFPGRSQAAAALVIAAGALVAGIRPWELLRGCAPLMLTALFVVLLRSIRVDGGEAGLFAFSRSGFIRGVLFGAGILLAFTAGSLLFSVTTMTELRDSLGKAECFFRKKKGVGRLALGLSLMLGFLPRFFEIWENADAAYRARAGKNGLRKILLLVPLVTERMIEAAVETATALEARGIGNRVA
jgi:energy-coupling factor transporter transmembrane protein EcfT